MLAGNSAWSYSNRLKSATGLPLSVSVSVCMSTVPYRQICSVLLTCFLPWFIGRVGRPDHWSRQHYSTRRPRAPPGPRWWPQDARIHKNKWRSLSVVVKSSLLAYQLSFLWFINCGSSRAMDNFVLTWILSHVCQVACRFTADLPTSFSTAVSSAWITTILSVLISITFIWLALIYIIQNVSEINVILLTVVGDGSMDLYMGPKGNWNFRISDLVKNPYGTNI